VPELEPLGRVCGHELDGIALVGRFGGNLTFGFAEEFEVFEQLAEFASFLDGRLLPLPCGDKFEEGLRGQTIGSEVEALEDDAQCLDALAEFLSDFGANLIEFGENDGTAGDIG